MLCPVIDRFIRVGLVALVLATLAPRALFADKDRRKETLLDYIRSRDDLTPKERQKWERELKKRFGGAALNEESERNVEVTVAKAILSSALFNRVDPARACQAAWNAWHNALGFVPPPIAIHYELLSLEGRQPRGRPLDLAFKFPDYYSEEIAPDLVAYWEQALKDGKIPDGALEETKEALAQTRTKMRPLLVDKLRLLAMLGRELAVARGAQKAEIEHSMREVEDELARAFSNVARRPEVLDARKRPYDRLRIQLEDMGLAVTAEDRLLDPDAPPPPRREVPERPGLGLGKQIRPESSGPAAEGSAPLSSTVKIPDELPLVEPNQPPPSGPLPPQPRPGDPDPRLDRGAGRSIGELSDAYRRRVEATVAPWLGTPYSWGSASRGAGTDCSGFTRGIYEEAFAIALPRMSRDQFRIGRSVPLDALRPGDLLFFDVREAGAINHVGIYDGDGKFAHASTGKGVVYARLDEKYYRRAYRGARRLLVFPE